MRPTLADVHRAREAIGHLLVRTPLLPAEGLTARIGAPAYAKAETLQRTGSFKVRGVLNAMARLPEAARARGVVTMSGGNAGRAVAWAARRQGVRAVIVVPASAAAVNVAAIDAEGAEIRIAGSITELQPLVDAAMADGLTMLHPFEDADLIAGHGSLALEILEDLPDTTVIVAGVGGGGLVGGIGVAAKALRPGIRIIGVEAEGAQAMKLSLERGSPQSIDAVRTIAVGLGAPYVGGLTYQLVRDLADDLVIVNDEEILDALRFVAADSRLLVEPAGVACVAALLTGRVQVGPADRVVAVLSGANADPERFAEWLAPG